MFNKKNDPLVESVKKVMEQNELLRKIEQSLLEEYGVQSRNALPHELHAEYDAILEEAKKKALDPVGKEDADIDNDGDMDKTDKYLHNRRKAIGAAIASKKLDEASYEKDIDETKPVVVHGVKGMKSTAFKKKFKNMDHFSKWSDSEEADEHTVHSVKNLKEDSEQLDEKAVSKAQHRFFGLVRAIQKGEAKGSSKAEKAAKEMTTKQVRDYAKTKEKGLPEKIDEERKRTMKVADAFMSGKKAKEKTLATDGKQITYHGNVIAKHADDEVHVSTAGYGTSTSTRGHVNGILRRLNAPTLSQRKGKVYHGDNEYDGESWIKVKKPSASKIDEESVFEEIRANLEEQLAYAYENYDDASFAEYVESLTEEEIDILGLHEQSSPMTGRLTGGGISGTRSGQRAVSGVPNSGGSAPAGAISGGGIPGTRSGQGVSSVPSSRGSTSTGTFPGGGIAGDAKRNVAPGGGSTANIRPQGSASGGLTALQGHGGGSKMPDSTQALRDVMNQKSQARRTSPVQSKAPTSKPVVRNNPVARPASRPVARPAARPKAAKPTRTTASQDFMANFQREETKPQIKESFEQFIRDKFFKG